VLLSLIFKKELIETRNNFAFPQCALHCKTEHKTCQVLQGAKHYYILQSFSIKAMRLFAT